MNDFGRYLQIRSMYASFLPRWMADYHATGLMHHDPYFLADMIEFTPIEERVWLDIRSAGIPFYPQMPALNYFLDFGCPFLKIGIECDGKYWHDKDLDAARDRRLEAAGWTIFRLEGRECRRVITAPWHCDESDHDCISAWYLTTSEGLVYSIKDRFFGGFAGIDKQLAAQTIEQHRSTQVTVGPRKVFTPTKNYPILAGDSLAGYLAMKRLPPRRGGFTHE